MSIEIQPGLVAIMDSNTQKNGAYSKKVIIIKYMKETREREVEEEEILSCDVNRKYL